jgi:hypothetical protein
MSPSKRAMSLFIGPISLPTAAGKKKAQPWDCAFLFLDRFR